MSTRKSNPNRRELLRAGLGGFTSLTLPGLFQLRAEDARKHQRQDSAIILIWLRGGASHLETWDPKPLAPSEYRGPYHPIQPKPLACRSVNCCRDWRRFPTSMQFSVAWHTVRVATRQVR